MQKLKLINKISIITILLILVSCKTTIKNKEIIKKENKKEDSENKNENVKDAVSIIEYDDYFSVVLDFSIEKNHRRMGEKFAKKVLNILPDYEKIVDSYLADFISNEREYKGILLRLDPFKKTMPLEYKEEIEGFAAKMSGKDNILNDGKLSLDELYLANLITDALRPTACSAVGVYGDKSITGKSLIGRVLDWNKGKTNQFAKIDSVITFKNGNKSITTIGVLGHFGVITGFNDNKIFTSILDSPTQAKYSNKNKRAYTFDIRFALENYDSIKDISNYLLDDEKDYAFNHLVFIASEKEVVILENNISGSGKNSKRALRKSDSKLNANINWGIDNSIAAVNSFVLNGNHDNHTISPHNKNRWASYKNAFLSLKDKKITLDDIKAMVTDKKGEIYNYGTRQIILFEPETLSLKIFFSNGKFETPTFKNIKIKF